MGPGPGGRKGREGRRRGHQQGVTRKNQHQDDGPGNRGPIKQATPSGGEFAYKEARRDACP